MAKNKLLIRVLSSGMQAVAVQVLGSLFFYLISVYISKNDFGIISWMNAVCLLLTTFLGFGLEQVVVRRIAASSRSDWAAMAFFVHSIAGFAVTFLLLFLLRNTASVGHYLPWFFIAQGLVYIAVPLKQFLNAKEQFTPYGVMALISNLGKIAAVCILINAGGLDIHSVIIILIVSALFELTCLLVYVTGKTTFGFRFRFKAYAKLLKEASAQYISVIFDISLSRMDWILLGLLSTNVALADYSFAYRAFELARLPMLVIGPLILPRLARLMGAGTQLDDEGRQQINSFARVEVFFAMAIPLVLNILWAPVVGLITHEKYGGTNTLQFLLLSVCMPLQLFINLLWSVSFSAKKYKQVTLITIVCAVFNIVLNLILIPQLNGLGAAAAFLLTTILQAVLYYSMVRKTIMNISPTPILWCVLVAAILYFFVTRLHINCVFQSLIAISAYVMVGILSRQVSKQHLVNFKQFLTQ